MDPESKIPPPLSAQTLRFIDSYCSCGDVKMAALEAGFSADAGAKLYQQSRVHTEITRRLNNIAEEVKRFAALQAAGGVPKRMASPPQPLEEILPTILEIQASGIRKYRQIAKALNERGVSSARGAAWSSNEVYQILVRARKLAG